MAVFTRQREKMKVTVCEYIHSIVSDSLQLHGLQQASISRSLLKLMSIESMMSSNHVMCCHPIFLLPSVFPSIQIIFIVSALYLMWPKFWTFSFSISPSNEYSGLIFLRIDWFDLLAVQGILQSLLEHQIQKHQFFRTQIALWSNCHIHT